MINFPSPPYPVNPFFFISFFIIIILHYYYFLFSKPRSFLPTPCSVIVIVIITAFPTTYQLTTYLLSLVGCSSNPTAIHLPPVLYTYMYGSPRLMLPSSPSSLHLHPIRSIYPNPAYSLFIDSSHHGSRQPNHPGTYSLRISSASSFLQSPGFFVRFIQGP